MTTIKTNEVGRGDSESRLVEFLEKGSERVMGALMQMTKIDLNKLQEAYGKYRNVGFGTGDTGEFPQ